MTYCKGQYTFSVKGQVVHILDLGCVGHTSLLLFNVTLWKNGKMHSFNLWHIMKTMSTWGFLGGEAAILSGGLPTKDLALNGMVPGR